jgi:predicted dehydrogenase
MNSKRTTRREVLTGIGAAGLSAGAAAAAESSSRDRVRLGIIGVGNRGREHMRTIKSGDFACDVVGICDVVPEHAGKALELGVGKPEVYTNYRDLLAVSGLDAVVVATPNFLHKEMVVAALERGLDVLCEKPMALNVAECDEMIRAWRSTDRVFMVGLQNRWHPCHVKVRELISEGVIGEVRHLAATEFRRDWKQIAAGASSVSHLNWRYFESLSGGSILEKHCHDFDLFQHWLSASPERVCGFGGTGFYSGRETLDHASLAIEYGGGCTVSLDFNIASRYGKGFHESMMVGTKGQLQFRRKGDSIRITTWEPERREETIRVGFDARESGHNGTMGLLQEFFDALRERRLPSTHALVGRQSVKLAQAAQAAVRGRPVVELTELGG